MSARVSIQHREYDDGVRYVHLQVENDLRPSVSVYCYLTGSKAGRIWGVVTVWEDFLPFGNTSLSLPDYEAHRIAEAILGPVDFARPALKVAA